MEIFGRNNVERVAKCKVTEKQSGRYTCRQIVRQLDKHTLIRFRHRARGTSTCLSTW